MDKALIGAMNGYAVRAFEVIIFYLLNTEIVCSHDDKTYIFVGNQIS